MPAKPFVKWVGGKRQLLPVLLPLLERGLGASAYHEPFLGGGAVFFALRGASFLSRAFLSDINRDLIDAYVAVADACDVLTGMLQHHETLNSESHFLKMRAWKLHPDVYYDTPIGRAARLIYLNRTCFNGLYRVNRKGEFNVPWGKYENPVICNVENLTACKLALENVTFHSQDFRASLSRVSRGDLVYLDPPYVPVSQTANFTSYDAAGFGPKEQEALAQEFLRLHRVGAKVVLSNADCERVRELYAGFSIHGAMARRNVNRDGQKRGGVQEVVVTNF